MNPAKHLERLHRAARRRYASMILLFDNSLLIPLGSQEREALTAYVVIESLNIWRNFVRAVYLSSALGTVTLTGTHIAPLGGVSSPKDAIRIAYSEYWGKQPVGRIKRRKEPRWHDASFLIRLFTKHQMRNAGSVAAGVAVRPHAIEHLTVFRNFYAHRNEEALSAAQRIAVKYGISAALRPTGVLSTPVRQGRRPLLREWLVALMLGAELCCQ